MAPGVLSIRLSLRFLRGHSGRLALTLLALASGVATVCSNSLTSRAVVQEFADVVDTVAGTAALQVRREDGGTFAKDVAIEVARVPGIAQVVPVLTATAFTSDGSGELIAVHAYDLANEAAARVYGVGSTDRGTVHAVAALSPGSVIVTDTFAQRRHLGIADRITLDTPTGRQSFTIAGLIPASGLARLYGGNLVVMDLYAAQLAFAHRGDINRVDVVLKPGEDADQMAERIRRVLPPGVQAQSPTLQKVLLEKTTGSVHLLLQVFIVGGLVAAFFIAFSGLSTLFERRMWEIGLLRALGARQRTIWRQLVLEGLLLGVLGVVIGIPMGVAYAHALLPRITAAAAAIVNTVSPVPQLELHLSTLLLAAMLGVGTGVAAAALPAWRASRVEVVETIKTRDVEHGVAETRTRRCLRALTVVAALAVAGVEVLSPSGHWSIAGGLLLIVAAAVAARPLVEFTASVVVRWLASMIGPFARLGLTQMARCPRRTALAVAMLAVGTGTVLWLWVLARSFEMSVTTLLTQKCRADLVVSSAHVASAFIEAPVDEALVTRLSHVAGVGAVVGLRDTEVPYAGGSIAIEADDPSYFLNSAFGQFPLIGRHWPDAWEAVAAGEAAIASANFVQNLNVGVGDRVTVPTPSGPLQLRIVGITNHFLSPRGTLIMSRDVYARAWDDRRISRAYVLRAEGIATASVRAAIAAGLGRGYNLRILSAPEMVEYFGSRVRAAFSAIYVLAFGTLILVLAGISETIAAEIVSCTRELGILRMLGARRRGIRHLVWAETFALSALGLLLAAATGLARAVLWVRVTFPHLFGFVVALHIPYGELAILLLLTLAVCLVAALLPAQRAAHLQPVAALRCE